MFVCAVNVGNSYNEANNQDYTEQSVENLAKNDSYFSFFLSRDVLGTDFKSGTNELGKLLKDMTGKDFNIIRERNKNLTKVTMEAISMEDSKSSYIIADVGGHFINITEIDADGNIEYFDPYIRNTPKEYTINDIKGAYIIQEKEAYQKLEQQNGKIE